MDSSGRGTVCRGVSETSLGFSELLSGKGKGKGLVSLPSPHAPLILLDGDTSKLSFPASIEATSLSFKKERDRERGTMREKEDRGDGGRERQKAKVENLPESPEWLCSEHPHLGRLRGAN